MKKDRRLDLISLINIKLNLILNFQTFSRHPLISLSLSFFFKLPALWQLIKLKLLKIIRQNITSKSTGASDDLDQGYSKYGPKITPDWIILCEQTLFIFTQPSVCITQLCIKTSYYNAAWNVSSFFTTCAKTSCYCCFMCLQITN